MRTSPARQLLDDILFVRLFIRFSSLPFHFIVSRSVVVLILDINVFTKKKREEKKRVLVIVSSLFDCLARLSICREEVCIVLNPVLVCTTFLCDGSRCVELRMSGGTDAGNTWLVSSFPYPCRTPEAWGTWRSMRGHAID